MAMAAVDETESSQTQAKNEEKQGGTHHAHHRLGGGGGGADIGRHFLVNVQGKANNAAAGSEGDGMVTGGHGGGSRPIAGGIGGNGLSGAIDIHLNRSTGGGSAGEGRILALVPPFTVLITTGIQGANIV